MSATLLVVNPVPTKDAQSLVLDDMEFNFGDGAQITSFAENAQFMFFATLRGTITLVNRQLEIHQTVKIQASSIGRLGITNFGNTLMFLSKPGQLTCLPITDESGVGLDEQRAVTAMTSTALTPINVERLYDLSEHFPQLANSLPDSLIALLSQQTIFISSLSADKRVMKVMSCVRLP